MVNYFANDFQRTQQARRDFEARACLNICAVSNIRAGKAAPLKPTLALITKHLKNYHQ